MKDRIPSVQPQARTQYADSFNGTGHVINDQPAKRYAATARIVARADALGADWVAYCYEYRSASETENVLYAMTNDQLARIEDLEDDEFTTFIETLASHIRRPAMAWQSIGEQP